MTTLAFIGFGELGQALASALTAAGAGEVRAWSRERDDPEARRRLSERIERAGSRQASSPQQAIDGAQAVLSVVPLGASAEIAGMCLPLIRPGGIFIDLSAAPPAAKEAAARSAATRGVLYADGAVLGTVAVSGAGVPIVVAGTGAATFRDLTGPARLSVDVLAGGAGQAARLKLIRSVYMKGRDALVLEMLLAAHRHGLEDAVVASIAGPAEQVSFHDLSERILGSLARHGARRADELEASSAELRATGIEPVMTAAGADRLRRLALLGLETRFAGGRPERGVDLLRAIEEAAG